MRKLKMYNNVITALILLLISPITFATSSIQSLDKLIVEYLKSNSQQQSAQLVNELKVKINHTQNPKKRSVRKNMDWLYTNEFDLDLEKNRILAGLELRQDLLKYIVKFPNTNNTHKIMAYEFIFNTLQTIKKQDNPDPRIMNADFVRLFSKDQYALNQASNFVRQKLISFGKEMINNKRQKAPTIVKYIENELTQKLGENYSIFNVDVEEKQFIVSYFQDHKIGRIRIAEYKPPSRPRQTQYLSNNMTKEVILMVDERGIEESNFFITDNDIFKELYRYAVQQGITLKIMFIEDDYYNVTTSFRLNYGERFRNITLNLNPVQTQNSFRGMIRVIYMPNWQLKKDWVMSDFICGDFGIACLNRKTDFKDEMKEIIDGAKQ